MTQDETIQLLLESAQTRGEAQIRMGNAVEKALTALDKVMQDSITISGAIDTNSNAINSLTLSIDTLTAAIADLQKRQIVIETVLAGQGITVNALFEDAAEIHRIIDDNRKARERIAQHQERISKVVEAIAKRQREIRATSRDNAAELERLAKHMDSEFDAVAIRFQELNGER